MNEYKRYAKSDNVVQIYSPMIIKEILHKSTPSTVQHWNMYINKPSIKQFKKKSNCSKY